MQGIADMLSVKINVLCSHHPMLEVTPSGCNTLCEVFVGQYHYVGLDRIPVSGSSVEQNAQNGQNVAEENYETHTDFHNATAADDTLADATIEEGDEHRRQITGAPLASMMCVENPEQIICVAPAEGERPQSFRTDPTFEAMSNPDKFPYGDGTFSSKRPRKLTYRKYKGCWMLMADLLETLIICLLPNTL